MHHLILPRRRVKAGGFQDIPFDTGWMIAGAGADAGSGDAAWTNTDRITVEDDNGARCDLKSDQVSNFIRAYQFGFALPTWAVVEFIHIKHRSSSMNSSSLAKWDSWHVLNTSNPNYGNNANISGTAHNNYTRGPPSGNIAPGITVAQINDPSFSYYLKLSAGTASLNVSIDAVYARITGRE